jgi:hypothetical protein
LHFERALNEYKTNLKVTWDILRKAIRKSKIKKSQISSINVNGTLVNDPKVIANCFNEFFTTIANTIADDIHPTVRPPEFCNDVNVPLFNINVNPVSNFEILTTFNELNSKKSEDFSGISMHFLKNLSLQLLVPLNHIINLSFRNGIVPRQLKIAKVVPIF